MILKNTYLKGHLLVTASKRRWFYDFQALWEIVERHCHYKCCVKYKKHLKTSVEFAKMLMEGFTFQQSWRLKASKSTEEKHSLMYFYGLFKIRYQKFVHTISLAVAFSFMFSFLFKICILFYIISTKIITFIYFKPI